MTIGPLSTKRRPWRTTTVRHVLSPDRDSITRAEAVITPHPGTPDRTATDTATGTVPIGPIQDGISGTVDPLDTTLIDHAEAAGMVAGMGVGADVDMAGVIEIQL